MPHIERRRSFFLIMIVIALFFLIVAFILLITPQARASTSSDTGLPVGATCEIVREKVAEHGKAVALAWALKQGFSFAQIRAAKRCLSTK
jgi:hypothetical protein